MKDKTLTAKQHLKEVNPFLYSDLEEHRLRGMVTESMESYAQYYARAVIESLTEDDIALRANQIWGGKSHESLSANLDYRDGMRWTKKELLKRIK